MTTIDPLPLRRVWASANAQFVRLFQHAFGLDIDGMAGIETVRKLGEVQKAAQPNPDDRTLSDLKINDWIDAEVSKYAEGDCSDTLRPHARAVTEIAQGAALQVIMNKAAFLDNLANSVHALNVKAGWWNDLETGEDLHGKRNVGELLALVHSEISEALEGHRKNLMDDKLPQYPMFRVELIDAIIRLLDILGSDREAQKGDGSAGAILMAKLAYNQTRADHKPENRRQAGGKAF